jgi:O-antigen ligase
MEKNTGFIAFYSIFSALLILLAGRFFWPLEASSWAALIRFLLFIGLIFYLPKIRQKEWNISWCFFLLFWGYLFLNAGFIPDSPQMLRRLFIILVFVYTASCALTNPAAIRRLMIVLALLGGLCALLSLITHAFQGNLTLAYREYSIHGSGIGRLAEFGNTNVAGINYAPSLVAAVWLALTTGRRARIWQWLACAFFIAVYIYFTYSRNTWLASIFSIGILLLALGTPKARKNSFMIMFATGILVIVFGHDAIMYELTERGVTGRDEIWQTVFERLSGHWITGYGAGAKTSPIVFHDGMEITARIHNIYIEILYQFGMIGLTLMLVTSFLVIFRLIAMRKNPIASLWLALLSGGLLAMTFDLNAFASSPNIVWIYFWLPVAGCLALPEDRARALRAL